MNYANVPISLFDPTPAFIPIYVGKKKMKKKCCEKYKRKGKRCKNCPGRLKMSSLIQELSEG